MSTLEKTHITPEEYLARERVAEERSEYYPDEIWAMSGGSPTHSLITLNVGARLHSRLEQTPCQTFSSDLRVQVSRAGVYFYPDVTVVCGELELSSIDKDAITNPSVIIEVISPSTESNDRGRKFAFYRQIPSLNNYVLAAQNKPLVEHYARQADDRWLLTELSGMNSMLRLVSPDCEIPLSEIYARVEFPQAA